MVSQNCFLNSADAIPIEIKSCTTLDQQIWNFEVFELLLQ